MLVLRLDFYAGRFHAPPWKDPASNSAEIEWPPHPWRILHMLVKRYAEMPFGSPEAVVSLFEKLAEPPRYALPRYQSDGEGADFDSSIRLDSGANRVVAAYILFDHAVLTEEESRILAILCDRVDRLAKNGSWCRLELISNIPANPTLSFVDLASRGGQGPLVSRRVVPIGLRGLGLLLKLERDGTSTRSDKTDVDYVFPPQYGWSDPHDLALGGVPASVLRFAFEQADRLQTPHVSDTVAVAEAMRGAAMRCFSALHGRAAPPLLSGKSPSGE